MTDNWTIEDLPIGRFNVTTEPNPVTGEIRQITEIAGRIQERVIQTQALQARNALIDLGWTPPANQEPQRPVLDPAMLSLASAQAEHIKLKGVSLHELTRADLMVLAVEYCMEHENEEEKGANGSQGNHAGGLPRDETPIPK